MTDGNKAWSGLVKGFYDRRYQIYADNKLSTKSKPNFVGDVMRLACEFAKENTVLPSTATGDSVATAKALWAKYAPTTPHR